MLWGKPLAQARLLSQNLSPGRASSWQLLKIAVKLHPENQRKARIGEICNDGSRTPRFDVKSARRAQHDPVGRTRPTDANGQAGQFFGGLFNVDFLARTISGGVSYKIGNVAFALPVPTGTSLLARPGVVGFLVTPRNGGLWTCATCNVTSGTIDVYAISGLFLGSRAQNLGVTFATLDQMTGRTAGAAVFRCRTCKP